MVEIAHAAGAQVVAERIETEAEAGALRAVGVEFGQGWLFGRPGQLSIAPTAQRAAQSGVAPADQVS
jgi:EAL domain-containing protein (putative c-di-GMP-specific phosphodiesterase class I)